MPLHLNVRRAAVVDRRGDVMLVLHLVIGFEKGFSSSVGLFSARTTSSKMSTSGVMVNPDVQTTFQKLSEGKKEFRYIIFKIEEREVVVEAAVSQEELGLTGDDYDDSSKAAFEKFVADIKARTDGFTDCRYAVFDFKFTCSRVGAGTSKMDKIVSDESEMSHKELLSKLTEKYADN
ncbi:Cofilin/tropomyosin-type actin-binding protein [Ancylostoma ceylanicum]|uniref:Cofilin/tropomyosin-type actin-binding protein n=1 Tax=Ancylostoma ceylanicum TaxID=53326 RepID=A0A0D6LEW9_9BILA|nr:Cofilin/tropomyosin-type actin-binding protein [Ancylostoma ceylanicum]